MSYEERISDLHYAVESEYERSSKRYMRALVKRLTSPARILDIGCGTGLNASFLRDMGHTIVGLDVSPVAVAKFRAKGFEGLVGDISAGTALPLPAASFDALYASEVIEHCVDTGAFLRELHRLLKPGGMLFLSTPNSAFWPYRILGLLGRTPTDYQHPGHVRFFSRHGLAYAIEAAGFRIESLSARNMYAIVGKGVGDRVAPILRALGFDQEPRFATHDHFWQLSTYAKRANAFWSDTFIVLASKRETSPLR